MFLSLVQLEMLSIWCLLQIKIQVLWCTALHQEMSKISSKWIHSQVNYKHTYVYKGKINQDHPKGNFDASYLYLICYIIIDMAKKLNFLLPLKLISLDLFHELKAEFHCLEVGLDFGLDLCKGKVN